MQCYTDLTPPTAVTHAVSLPFLSPKTNNLVVAKTSLLQVFQFKSIVTDAESKSYTDPKNPATLSTLGDSFIGDDIQLQRTENTTKLVLVSEHVLSGTVVGFARVKLENTRTGGDALLIAFKDAKLSLIEWDPENHSIVTVSIHYYEGEELLSTPWAVPLNQSQSCLSVDPQARCAALKFNARSLAILPFRYTDDEIVEDDFDIEMDFGNAEDKRLRKEKLPNGDVNDGEGLTPYKSSFVLSLTALEPTLTHPVHFAFLHEYREPTFGILSSSKAPASSLLSQRKDCVEYNVLALDLEHRASTTLISVQSLPIDLFMVFPLPLPVGGALLIGSNELVHVDQSGKTNAVAVNEFAKQSSSFNMNDQAELALKLEGCTVESLGSETGDLLLITSMGALAIISFQLDGRSVSALSVHKVAENQGGQVLNAAMSSAALLSRGRMFLGSEKGDSAVLGWTSKAASLTLSRKRSHADMLGQEAEVDSGADEDDDDDVDDLYGTEESPKKQKVTIDATTSENYTFRVHDRLISLAPITDFALRKPKPFQDSVELVTLTGRGGAGAVTVMQRDICPGALGELYDIDPVRAAWSVQARYSDARPAENQQSEDAYPNYMIVSRSKNGTEESAVYKLVGNGLRPAEVSLGDFDAEGATVDAGTLAEGTRIIQVQKAQIKSFEADFSLAQILPMEDDNGDELAISSATFCDPYVLIIREDSSMSVLQVDSKGELEELDRGDGIKACNWLSGCLYKPTSATQGMLACLLNADGGLHIFQLPDLSKAIFVAEGLKYLPFVLTPEYSSRRSAAMEILAEIMVADIGDAVSKSPYMIVRTASDDLVMYEPYHYPQRDPSQPFTTNLRWKKISQPRLAHAVDDTASDIEESDERGKLKALADVNGYSTVVQAGQSPCLVLKEASTTPKLVNVRLSGHVKNICSFQQEHHDRDAGSWGMHFSYVDETGKIRSVQIPADYTFGTTGWAIRKTPLHQDVQGICYYGPKDVHVVATGRLRDFVLPDDDFHTDWNKEDIAARPQVETSAISIFHPQSQSIVDTFELEQAEVVLCTEVLNLEVSEITHVRKALIGVGTAVVRGEDLTTNGNIYIFEIITVVPEPGQPHTNVKLKLISREEVKGAVTALSDIGTQGFFLVAQGQKCMVRGLKEDNTLLPLAFMDMQCHVTVGKALGGTGMALMGDALEGLWFVGYTEDPYKMIQLGKSKSRMEIVAAEFLPANRSLFIVAADAECNLHILQYEPDDPKSLSGHRLINRSVFRIGHLPTTMKLLTSSIFETTDATPNGIATNGAVPEPSITSPLSQILLATQSGSLAVVTPVDEHMYRRLNALQTYVTNQLEHACGLNPRAYRVADGEGLGGRGVVDGALAGRWVDLGSQRRAEACVKVGIEEWVVRNDLEFVSGGGLGLGLGR
ncbi:protein CFT1 [Aulographum hederae CBS 113979]|uniref:Protein CFT1 n=1 Tax=Aulographum hederae CBS 113979 TaxID=1176131 RepID=A0A6G1HHB8_9PEZI|nr:protein CFT1 [Aulographum hederae CBS 113979]